MSLSTIPSSVKRGAWQMWRRPSEWLAMTLSMAILLGSLALGGSVWRALAGDVERFPDASRLVVFYGAPLASAPGAMRPDVARLSAVDVFSSASAFTTGTPIVETPRGSFQLRAALVAERFFAVLGAEAVDGELPQPPMAGVALSESAARQLFPGARAVGQAVRIEGRSLPVVAVVAAGYEYPREVDLWIPFGVSDGAVLSEAIIFRGVGRMRPGVSLAQAQQSISRSLNLDLDGAPFGTIDTERKLRGAPVARASAVATIALAVLAVAAVALLLVVQTSERLGEYRIRLMLGASRGTLGAERIAETLVPLVCAAFGAYTITHLAAVWIGSSSEVAFDVLKRVEVSGPMFLTGVGVVLLVLVAAAVPIVAGTTTLAQRVRESRTSKLVVGLQMALAVVLGVLAMALHRSVEAFDRQDRGFAAEDVLTARLSLPADTYGSREARNAAWDEILRDAQRLPGVRAVAASSIAPFESAGFALLACAPVGRTYQGPNCLQRGVSTDYFAALRMPLLAGRTFSPADTLFAEPVCILSRGAATAIFGDAPRAIGQMVRLGRGDARVVGVVGEISEAAGPRGQRPTAYRPLAQWAPGRATLVIAGGYVGAVAAGVRQIVRGFDDGITVPVVQPLSLLVRRSFAKERLMASVVASLAAIGLTLAFLSMYALMTRFLTSRVKEIAIRQAIGATRANLLRWATWVVGVPALFGLVSGAAASSLGQRTLSRLVYGLTGFAASDVAWVVLAIAAGIAVAVSRPMLHALRASPATVLRHD